MKKLYRVIKTCCLTGLSASSVLTLTGCGSKGLLDGLKTIESVAATAKYFPDQVEQESGSHAIDYAVMLAPISQGGAHYAVQQGVGMVVSKPDEQHEYAVVEFLKWFTQTDNNLQFGSVSGYLPVLKEASSVQALDQAVADRGLPVAPKTYDCLSAAFNGREDMTLYTNKSFRNGSAARKVLDYNLADQAAEDRAKVMEELAQGKSLEDASAPYVTGEAFEQWYDSFCDALNAAVKK